MSPLRLKSDRSRVRGFLKLPIGIIILLSCIAGIGVMALYSAGGGSFSPWAGRHLLRFLLCMGILIALSYIHIRHWYKLAYPLYITTVLMLVYVDLAGYVGMGAQRWINLGFMSIQPSELMKITTILALARYFHGMRADQLRQIKFIIPPLVMLSIPIALVALQPDLGTAMMIIFVSACLFFLGGVALWMFGIALASVLVMLPIFWTLLHDYQRARVLTFLNPDADPLGAGYHITQSKIALGSGGVMGKGYLEGSQSHLDFLPEKHTDFIFTLWAEEWGLFGSMALIALYGLVIAYGFWMSQKVSSRFSKLVILGIVINFGFYALINIAMVMGLIPVVGVPLVLISYGGTAMMSVMVSFGILASAWRCRDTKMPRAIV